MEKDNDNRNKILMIIVIAIFILFASYNFGAYFTHTKYNKASTINEELAEVMELVKDNPEALAKLETINEDIKFINAFCFDEGDLE